MHKAWTPTCLKKANTSSPVFHIFRSCCLWSDAKCTERIKPLCKHAHQDICIAADPYLITGKYSQKPDPIDPPLIHTWSAEICQKDTVVHTMLQATIIAIDSSHEWCPLISLWEKQSEGVSLWLRPQGGKSFGYCRAAVWCAWLLWGECKQGCKGRTYWPRHAFKENEFTTRCTYSRASRIGLTATFNDKQHCIKNVRQQRAERSWGNPCMGCLCW